jgi:hypothetical protein
MRTKNFKNAAFCFYPSEIVQPAIPSVIVPLTGVRFWM